MHDFDPTTPQETWAPARRLAERVLRPIERYMHVEATSGVVLLLATSIAPLPGAAATLSEAEASTGG